MTLDELRKALAEKVTGLAALKTKAMATEATAEDATALQKAIDDIEALEAKIAMVEKTDETIKRAARPANDPATTRTDPQVKDSPKETAQKVGLVMAGMIKAYREGGAKGPKAALEGMRELGYERLADELYAEQRALNSTSGAAGGVTIGENFAPDIIPLLYPLSSFMQGNPMEIPMPGGNYRQSGGATGASASYRGEGAAISPSRARS